MPDDLRVMEAELLREDPMPLVDLSTEYRCRRFARRRIACKLVSLAQRLDDEGMAPTWARTQNCGKALGSVVELRVTPTGQAYPAGIETCANVWVCAVCSAKIKTRRAQEVQEGAAAHVAAGGQLVMLTVTVRHHRWMPLKDVMGGLSGGWKRLTNTKAWREIRSNVVGTIKATEVTVGENGWHPHLHVLLLVKAGVSLDEVEARCSELYEPWSQMATESLGLTPTAAHALNVRRLGAESAAYVSKIAKETASADTKGTRTPFDLLDGADQGVAEDCYRFMEYAETMRGRHSLDWSKGLRKLLGVGETSDEELAAADEDGNLVEVMDAGEWNRLSCTTDEQGVPLSARYLAHVEDRWRLGILPVLGKRWMLEALST